eukprot:2539653-Alexandrium_andersonii.AAC.1
MHGIAPAIGLRDGLPWLGGQAVFPECLQQLCAPREVADVSLSCLGRFLRGAPIAGEQPAFPAPDGCAPAVPNVYSDGGWKSEPCPPLACATFGVYVPPEVRQQLSGDQ